MLISYHTSPDNTDIERPFYISEVWEAIVNGKIEKDSTNPRLWTLPGDKMGMGKVKIFHNREYYDKIIEKAAFRRNLFLSKEILA